MSLPESQVLTRLALDSAPGIFGEDSQLMAPPRCMSTPTLRRSLLMDTLPQPCSGEHILFGSASLSKLGFLARASDLAGL